MMKKYIPIFLIAISFLYSCGKQDETKPVITMKGKNPDTLIVKTVTTYNDAGCTAQDDIDGDVTANIIVSTNVKTDVPGRYIISYAVEDKAGNVSEKLTRYVDAITATASYQTTYNCLPTQTDTISITANSSNDVLTITGIQGFAVNITAQLSGTSFVINSQQLFPGTDITGTITASGSTLTLNFTLTTGGSPTNCIAMLKRI